MSDTKTPISFWAAVPPGEASLTEVVDDKYQEMLDGMRRLFAECGAAPKPDFIVCTASFYEAYLRTAVYAALRGKQKPRRFGLSRRWR